MNYEKEKKHDHLFTEWENKFTIKFNKDKEFYNIENLKKELLFIKKNPKWELKKKSQMGIKDFLNRNNS